MQTLGYDYENRLVEVRTYVQGKLESIGSYRYDILGRRVVKRGEKDGHTEHKHFFWQGLRLLRDEWPGHSRLYLYERDIYAPLARVDTESRVYYFHIDQIGTPLEMTNAEGQLVWQASTEPRLPSPRWS